MSTLGLESVLVGDVGDDVFLAKLIYPSVGSGDAVYGILHSADLDLGGFLLGGSIAELVAVLVAVEADVVVELFLDHDGLTAGWADLSAFWDTSKGDGYESGENYDLEIWEKKFDLLDCFVGIYIVYC